MATLKAQNFDLDFSYYQLDGCDEIEYSLEVKLNGKPFFNSDIFLEKDIFVSNGKFLISDCSGYDWLMVFFNDVVKTRENQKYISIEPPDWYFETEFFFRDIVRLRIRFPYGYYLEKAHYTSFEISFNTTYGDIANFLNEFEKEMRIFRQVYSDRIYFIDDCIKYVATDEELYCEERDDKYREKKRTELQKQLQSIQCSNT